MINLSTISQNTTSYAYSRPAVNRSVSSQSISEKTIDVQKNNPDKLSISFKLIGKNNNKEAELTKKNELSESEKKVTAELKKIDSEVRAHEQAHMAAGGGLVKGGASFSYQLGPDGMRYATGGEVQIDMSAERDAKATAQKMQQVIRAALAPQDPSGQDRAVAAQAAKIQAEALSEAASESVIKVNPKNEKIISYFSALAVNKYKNDEFDTRGFFGVA